VKKTKFQGLKVTKGVFLYVGAVALVLFCLFPFIWMISSSLKTTFELYGSVTYFPHKLTLASYVDLFQHTFFATSVFAIITSWNEYLFAMLFISSDWKKTIPVGLTGFITAHEDRWDLIFSGSVMASIPILIFFIYIQKFLIEAWGSGGVKG